MNPATKKYKEMRIIWYQSSAVLDGGGLGSNTIKITRENGFKPKFYPTQIISSISIGKKKKNPYKRNLTSKFPLYINMNSKWIIELNIKHKTLNCLE